jgi:hypothetical protein
VKFIWNTVRRKPVAADIELPSPRTKPAAKPDVRGALKKAGEGYTALKKRGIVGTRSPSKR